MSTWGVGPLMSDSAQDFLDQVKGLPVEERVARVEAVLTRVADNPAVIMKEYVPEEVVAAAAIVAATLLEPSAAALADDETLLQVVSGMPPQGSMIESARTAFEAAVNYGNSWIISSWSKHSSL